MHAEAELASEVHEDDADAAGLAGDSEAAGRRHGAAEGRVEAQVRVVAQQSEAVRSDHPHVVGPREGGEVVLDPGALGAELAEPRGHDDRGPDPGRDGVP